MCLADYLRKYIIPFISKTETRSMHDSDLHCDILYPFSSAQGKWTGMNSHRSKGRIKRWKNLKNLTCLHKFLLDRRHITNYKIEICQIY